MAAFFGVSGITQPCCEYTTIQWNHLVAGVFVALQIMFTLENLVDCYKLNRQKTLYFLAGPGLALLTASLSGLLQTETFTNQFVVFHLLHSLCFNVTEYRLMVANMTKSEFRFYGLENFIAAIPLVIHLMAPGKTAKIVFEPFISYFCIVAAYILFYAHLFFLSNQYLARNPDKSFWVIKNK